ncbi:MAG: hypothetical protein V3T83_10490 [Acidobacteriota bacterium]
MLSGFLVADEKDFWHANTVTRLERVLPEAIEAEVVYRAEAFSNLSGGIEQGSRYLDNLDLQLTLDAEQILAPGRSIPDCCPGAAETRSAWLWLRRGTAAISGRPSWTWASPPTPRKQCWSSLTGRSFFPGWRFNPTCSTSSIPERIRP